MSPQPSGPGLAAGPLHQPSSLHQLGGIDASFLYQETPTVGMHTISVTIWEHDGSRIDNDLWAEFKQGVADRLHLVPFYRRRLVEVPGGLDHPYWADDPDFDLEYHVRRIGCPQPGGPRELSEFIERIHSNHLDRNRPLWELYLVDGLADGNLAMVSKTHHAVIDGASGTQLGTVMLDLEPDPAPVAPPDEPWDPAPLPSPAEMLGRGLVGAGLRPLKMAAVQREVDKVGGDVVRDMAEQNSVVGRSPVEAALARSRGDELIAPPTVFNRSISPQRRLAHGDVRLDDFRTVKSTFSTTVNDVVLAVCGSALRGYLLERGELPEQSLLAMVPISIRPEGYEGYGNQVSSVVGTLATDLDDPIARLHAVAERMRAAKEQHKALPATLMTDLAETNPPLLMTLAARELSSQRIADHLHPRYNVVISNIPGARVPLYSGGRRLLGGFPVSQITEGMGLNITVSSYLDTVSFGIVGDRGLVGQGVWELLDRCREALAEYVQLAEDANHTPATPSPV